MRWIGNVLREVFGLFVDDWRFAACILAWLLCSRLLLPLLEPYAHWTGIILFAGLAVILLESATRRAGR